LWKKGELSDLKSN